MNSIPGASRFDGPRSPPNTSHVPCKFFRQGACQAGNACPFSHDIGNAAENICKYFAKGNCKFGPKCANVHILPDGRRVNYHKGSFTIGGTTPIPLGSRVSPTTYHQTSSSALTTSFMRAGGSGSTSPYNITHGGSGNAGGGDASAGAPGSGRFPGSPDEALYGHHLGRQPSLENGLPTIDTTYSSNPTSAYGSPRDDDTINRFGLGLSPAAKGLSVLDAPLPASFDSNGISHAARYGPWPSSVPSKFGLESPSPSLNAAKDGRTSETLKLLHTSAFGSSEHLSPSALAGAEGGSTLGSSPPVPLPASTSLGSLAFGVGASAGTGAAATGVAGGGGLAPMSNGVNGAGDEYFGKQPPGRALHSASLRYAKPRMLSSSAPKFERDWEPEFLFEEDYVPDLLANEVLTPAEKARRTSLRVLDNGAGSGPSSAGGLDGAAVHPAMPGAAKYGSPGMAASPSRWGPLFQRQREEEGDSAGLGGSGHPGKAMKHAAGSAFGHVGSPLRQSSLAIGDDMGGGAGDLGDGPSNSAHISSRPLSGSSASAVAGLGSKAGGSGAAGESLSVLTQQLQRTRIGDESSGGSSPRLHPHAARAAAGGPYGALGGGAGILGKDRDRQLERHVSSGSIGSSAAGRFTTPIDEEDAAFVFSMEEEDDALTRARKRVSGGALNGLGGAGWSYAGVVAGKGTVPSTGSLAGPQGRDGGSDAVVDGVAGR